MHQGWVRVGSPQTQAVQLKKHQDHPPVPRSPASKQPGPWFCGMVASFVVRATLHPTALHLLPTRPAGSSVAQEWPPWASATWPQARFSSQTGF